MNYDLINLIQLMFLVICFTGILSYTLYTYKSFKHKTKENITRSVLIQWLGFIKKVLAENYIIYEKYVIWIYVERLKIEMMF
ncbi:hypothetical protein [Clostridium estertheticum]|uniref:hypothetical protein n=1 Tax=Clostridium estertheticum TaxID=238834 RepID=UPI001CF3C05E|nr:hypothetical protein [Clostridium estertheticum]MCB2353651.1 hypothetical protein [Clostridium estertheticum]WAG40640.1 hypothetical protein LL065_20685 [Clostridium estertheticum]